MSEKRRDNRNRILREGEYQRKDGRYRFRYIDEDGKEKNVYSWRLDKNDPMPKGKKREPSLREKEKQIEADLFDRIVTNGGNYTVLELVEKYVSLKTGVRHNTVAGYKTVINMLKKERLLMKIRKKMIISLQFNFLLDFFISSQIFHQIKISIFIWREILIFTIKY